jgi:hypothetical protein
VLGSIWPDLQHTVFPAAPEQKGSDRCHFPIRDPTTSAADGNGDGP